MIRYFLIAILAQASFLILYELFFKKTSFFNTNRLYLWVTSVLSLAIPFIKTPALKIDSPPLFGENLSTLFIHSEGSSLPGFPKNSSALIETWDLCHMVWVIGLLVMTLWFFYKITQLFLTINKNPKKWSENLLIIQLLNSRNAFSFFHYIFLGNELTATQKKVVLEHEGMHYKMGHSWDLLWFELYKIFFWFSPFSYRYQYNIRLLHEYQVDFEMASKNQKTTYIKNLLELKLNVKSLSITNTFINQSFIKKRIVMLHKSKSKNRKKLSYLLFIPLLFALVLIGSCETEPLVDNSADRPLEQILIELQSNMDNRELQEAERKKLMDMLRNIITHRNPPSAIEEIVEIDGEIQVPFQVIDEVPIFPGCEGNVSNKELKKCFEDQLNQFVNKNFNTHVVLKGGLKGRQRITVLFKINKQGSITDVKARAPSKELAEEAKRVVSSISKVIPGKQGGETVNVSYALPIIFAVE